MAERQKPDRSENQNEHTSSVSASVISLIEKHADLLKLAIEHPHKATLILKDFEQALTSQTFNNQQISDSGSIENIRKSIEKTFALPELTDSDKSNLENLSNRIQTNPEIFDVLFCLPKTALVLGGAMIAPILYQHFTGAGNEDIMRISQSLFKILTLDDSRTELRQLMIRSVFINYTDCFSSQPPKEYFHATRTSDRLIHSNENVSSAANLLVSLFRASYPVPVEIWNALSTESQKEISQNMPLELLINWTNSRLKSLVAIGNECSRSCERIPEHGSLNSKETADRQPEKSIEEKNVALIYHRILAETEDVLGLLNSIYDFRCSSLEKDLRYQQILKNNIDSSLTSDPLYGELLQASGEDKEEIKANRELFFKRRLDEIVGDRIVENLAELVEVVLDLYSHPKNQVRLPTQFIYKLTETLELLWIDLSSEIEDLYIDELLNAFDTALDRVDLPSAQGIRMLYPAQLNRTDTFEREQIDDYIESIQPKIISTLEKDAHRQAQKINRAIENQLTPLSQSIEAGIQDIERFLKVFVSRQLIIQGDANLIVAFPNLISSLLSYDYFDLWGSTADSWKRIDSQAAMALFKGCRLASQLLGKLDANVETSATIMGLSLKLNDTNSAVVSHFISHTNRTLLQCLRAVSKGKMNFNDILPEYDQALAAERLFIATRTSTAKLPTPITLRLQSTLPSRELGLKITQFKAEVATPSDGLPNILPADYRLLQLYAADMIGQPDGDYKKRHLSNLLNIKHSELLELPPALKHAFFISILEYGQEVLDISERTPEDLTNSDFNDLAKHLIGGFFINSPDITISNRGQMALLLVQLLRDPRAEIIFGKDLINGASKEFQLFAQYSILGINPYDVITEDSSIKALERKLHLI